MKHQLIGETYEKQKNFERAIISCIAETFCSIGDLYNALNDFDRALAMYEEALKIQIHSLPLNHPSTAQTYMNIDWVYMSKQMSLT